MDSSIIIRAAEPRDYAAILSMNAANVEVLAPMDERGLAQFSAWAKCFWVAEVRGQPAAFLIALREGLPYRSENYTWFSARYPSFLYVDRVVIDAPYRKLGLGRRLYGEVIRRAERTSVPVVCAEIDTEPVYNEPSLRFHAAMGFREVGTQYVRNGAVKVSLQVREV